MKWFLIAFRQCAWSVVRVTRKVGRILQLSFAGSDSFQFWERPDQGSLFTSVNKDKGAPSSFARRCRSQVWERAPFSSLLIHIPFWKEVVVGNDISKQAMQPTQIAGFPFMEIVYYSFCWVQQVKQKTNLWSWNGTICCLTCHIIWLSEAVVIANRRRLAPKFFYCQMIPTTKRDWMPIAAGWLKGRLRGSEMNWDDPVSTTGANS